MRIEFVNHASFVIEAAGLSLLSDPWLEGRAFDESWGLLAPSAFGDEDFARITHLWFSHEHPDHFHPPTLKRIPPEHRARITVLFQTTRDRKVVEFCRKLGFAAVQELPADRWVELAPGFEVCCGPQPGFQDSWLGVKAAGRTLLNLNDCALNDAERIDAIGALVGPVDVLATQFSISAWDGNREQRARRRAGARQMLERAVLQCARLEPRFLLPIASFIWFCHEENAWMNDGFLPLDEVVQGFRDQTRARPVVMYPGDRWKVGAEFDSAHALERYAQDEASIATRPRSPAQLVAPEVLIASSREWCRALVEGSDPLRLRLRLAAGSARRRNGRLRGLGTIAHRMLRPEECRLFVSDHQRAYALSPFHGLRPIELAREACDLTISSAALSYAFRFLWGGETLLFNGRFHEQRGGGRARLFAFFHMAGARNFGQTVSWRTFPRDLLARLRSRRRAA